MTPRATPEWIGRRPESMPTAKVQLRLFDAQGGICACGCCTLMNFDRDDIDCDHRVPLKDGGENRESNLQLLLPRHHVTKTSAENVARAAAERHKAKAFTRPKRGGFRKAERQRTATRAIVRKADRRSQEETS
jgi:5-methylcytosine-specific restriction endonuclease McrA